MKTFENRDDVLTLLVHLGYLGFDQKTDCVFIPNAEVRAEFLSSVKNCKWNEVIQAIEDSEMLLWATWNMEEDKVASMIKEIFR